MTPSQRLGGLWAGMVRGCPTCWVENGQEGATTGEQVESLVVKRCHVVGNVIPGPEFCWGRGPSTAHIVHTTHLPRALSGSV